MRTSSTTFLAAALIAAPAAPAHAAARVSQPAGWGLGLMLGSPTGLTAKHWLGGANAIDLGFGEGPGLRLHGDYLWGLAEVVPDRTELTLDLYVGAGGALGAASGPCFYYRRHFCDGGAFIGARVPLGIEARIKRAPLTFGLEAAPVVWLGDFFDAWFDVFAFARFIF